jgi:uncharacterized radical SAM superfamily protein
MISRTVNQPPIGIVSGRPVYLTPSHEEAIRLFRQGRDTVDIAKWIGCDEPRAARLLAEAREAMRAGRR